MIKRALISISNKEGIVDFAEELSKVGIEIFSTTGTAEILRKEGISVKDVSTITGFSELLGGRVKTLHPTIHAGILARGKEREKLRKQGMTIDLVACNFYRFNNSLDTIDIGGPSMVRAAAKNWMDVVVVTDPSQYTDVASRIRKGDVDEKTRKKLAMEAFSYTARYDSLIANWLAGNSKLPKVFDITYQKEMDLRYGENPHQNAVLYGKMKWKKIQGKKLSYNNILDMDCAINCIGEFEDLTCAIIKHATPCGIASASSILKAWKDALATDEYSPFGGVVVVNRELDGETAKDLSKIFLEVILAPSFTKDAIGILSKKKKLRLMEMELNAVDRWEWKSINGGLLLQDRDLKKIDAKEWEVVTKKKPAKEDIKSMIFGVKCVKHIKSNAVVFVKGTRTIAMGGGQTSRVDSSWIAVHKGKDEIADSIMASDAFFPFRDAVDVAAEAGVKAIVQPGGSIRDKEIIDAANEQGIAMVFSGRRYFRH